MRLSYYGWCCADGCTAEATSRVRMEMDAALVLLVPVCDLHFKDVIGVIESFEGAALEVVRT